MFRAATNTIKTDPPPTAERIIFGLRMLIIAGWMAGCTAALAALLWYGR